MRHTGPVMSGVVGDSLGSIALSYHRFSPPFWIAILENAVEYGVSMLIKLFGPSLLLLIVAAVIVYEQRVSLPFEEYVETRDLAMSLCSEKIAEQPRVEFSTDGCTLWPDGFNAESNWSACCVRSDVDYWCGGTSDDRITTDNTFRECVKKESAIMATLMFYSSRLFGHPMMPAPWRWGWGHADYPRGYEAVNSASSSEESKETEIASTTPN